MATKYNNNKLPKLTDKVDKWVELMYFPDYRISHKAIYSFKTNQIVKGWFYEKEKRQRYTLYDENNKRYSYAFSHILGLAFLTSPPNDGKKYEV